MKFLNSFVQLQYIPQRLSSSKLCDAIAVFDEGKLTEPGTYTELIAKKGKYAELFGLQAQLNSIFALLNKLLRLFEINL